MSIFSNECMSVPAGNIHPIFHIYMRDICIHICYTSRCAHQISQKRKKNSKMSKNYKTVMLVVNIIYKSLFLFLFLNNVFFFKIYLITKFAKCPHSRASLTLTAETSSSRSHILGWNTFSRMFMARHLLHLKYTFLMFMKFLHPFPRQ